MLEIGCSAAAKKAAEADKGEQDESLMFDLGVAIAPDESVATSQKAGVESSSEVRQVEQLRHRLSSLEQGVDEGFQHLYKQNATMLKRVDRLQARISSLEREIKRKFQSLNNRVDELNTRTSPPEDELKRSRKSQQIAPSSPIAPEKADLPELPADELESIYEDALYDFYNYRYYCAIDGFLQVLSKELEGDLADNAQYWMGECYYGLRDYRRALTEFRKVFSYDNTNKGDAAQVMIGYCHLRLGERGRAVEEFSKVLTDYPDSKYVDQVKSLIEKLKE